MIIINSKNAKIAMKLGIFLKE